MADQGFIQPIELHQHSAEIPVRLCPFGLEHDRAEIGRFGLGFAFGFGECRAEIDVSGGQRRVQRDGGPAAFDRRFALTKTAQDPAEIAVGHGLAWAQSNRAAIAGRCFLQLPLRLSHIPQIEMGIGKIGAAAQGALNEIGSHRELAAIEGDHPEQMRGGGIIRHQFECSLIKLLSLLQLSCAVERHTLLQSLARLVAAILRGQVLDCSSRHPKEICAIASAMVYFHTQETQWVKAIRQRCPRPLFLGRELRPNEARTSVLDAVGVVGSGCDFAMRCRADGTRHSQPGSAPAGECGTVSSGAG